MLWPSGQGRRGALGQESGWGRGRAGGPAQVSADTPSGPRGNLFCGQIMGLNAPFNQHRYQQCVRQPATASRHLRALRGRGKDGSGHVASTTTPGLQHRAPCCGQTNRDVQGNQVPIVPRMVQEGFWEEVAPGCPGGRVVQGRQRAGEEHHWQPGGTGDLVQGTRCWSRVATGSGAHGTGWVCTVPGQQHLWKALGRQPQSDRPLPLQP